MPKPIIVAGIIGGVIAIGGAIAIITMNAPKGANSETTTTQSTSTPALDDPSGDYAFFSDPSVAKYPEKNATFGNGETLIFEYDGTKTNNDEYATLSYQLYYIQDNGKVIPMGGGSVEGRGKGAFTLSDKVFDSNAKNRSGFLELTGTYTSGTSGTNVKLGMYPIKFNTSE